MTKIKLQKVQKTKTISIPGLEGSEVVIVDSLILADMPDGLQDAKAGNDAKKIAGMLKGMIQSWNFTIEVDGKDVDAEISEENISQYFTANQISFILNEILALAQDSKKD